MQKINLQQELVNAYNEGVIDTQQYKTLVGICEHNDEKGARKGLEKLRRRYKREHKLSCRSESK